MKDFEREIERLQQVNKLDEVFLLRNQSKKGIGLLPKAIISIPILFCG